MLIVNLVDWGHLENRKKWQIRKTSEGLYHIFRGDFRPITAGAHCTALTPLNNFAAWDGESGNLPSPVLQPGFSHDKHELGLYYTTSLFTFKENFSGNKRLWTYLQSRVPDFHNFVLQVVLKLFNLEMLNISNSVDLEELKK